MRSNCLFYAWREYRREMAHWRASGRPAGMEPRLHIRPSRLAPDWVPSFGVAVPLSPAGDTYAVRKFVPFDKRPLKGWRVVFALWFSGYVQYHDEPT